jgi:hypothetical protein
MLRSFAIASLHPLQVVEAFFVVVLTQEAIWLTVLRCTGGATGLCSVLISPLYLDILVLRHLRKAQISCEHRSVWSVRTSIVMRFCA